ncbi:hypothetical protein [Nitrospira sp. Nam74]
MFTSSALVPATDLAQFEPMEPRRQMRRKETAVTSRVGQKVETVLGGILSK